MKKKTMGKRLYRTHWIKDIIKDEDMSLKDKWQKIFSQMLRIIKEKYELETLKEQSERITDDDETQFNEWFLSEMYDLADYHKIRIN